MDGDLWRKAMNVKMKAAAPEVEGEPVWDIAYLFPSQGAWTEEDYLGLETNRPVEFSNGYLEFLPMPTQTHQFIVFYLYRLLLAFVETHQLGVVLGPPFRVQVAPKEYREPDVIFMLAEHHDRRTEAYWIGADLVMEVVSGSREDRKRDLVTKRGEYSEAGITEYWMVDPVQQQITVLQLQGEAYIVHGEFRPGDRATSALLLGFAVEVAAVFAAAK
jgi:Uma2 family endonuclease